MKGTIKKTGEIKKDELLKAELLSSEKERAENVMIVDLTRNDLSKIAEKGSVSVKELFGVYEFPQVYQMISTVEAQLKENTSFSSILKALFPMGSMTGAPKLNAIKIIDEVECFSRGLLVDRLDILIEWRLRLQCGNQKHLIQFRQTRSIDCSRWCYHSS